MGFFKLFFYLKRILYKIPKKILVYILIIIIVFMLSTSSHASQVEVTNQPNQDIVESYRKKMDANWYRYVYDAIHFAKTHNNTFNSNIVTIFNNITTSATNYRFGVYDANYYSIYFKNSYGSYYQYQNTRLALACALANDDTDQSSVIIPTAHNSGSGELYSTIYNPATVLFYQTNTNNYVFSSISTIEIIDVYDNYIPTSLFDTVYHIGQGDFDFTSVDTTLDQISAKIDETNDQLEQMNDFFNSDTTPTVTPNDLPSDSMNDITASGFNGIFTKIYNEVTYDNNSRIKITIPYVNYDFYLYSNYLTNTLTSIPLFQNFTWGDYSICSFIQLLWSFAIYRYIVLDIYKYINQIKNGNISTTDTNIKADML